MAEREVYTLVPNDAPLEQVELADAKGKQFIKQLVKYGTWADPNDRKNGKMKLDKTWGQSIVDNFTKKVVGRVPVPLGHPSTAADLAQLNRGELIDLDNREDGLYGVVEIRDPKTAEDIINDLIWDVSVSFDNHYVDTKNGKDVGPTLFHVGLLTDPYLKGMTPFKALANNVRAIMLSESEEISMSNVSVKNDREFAVVVSFQDGEEAKEVTVEPGQEIEVPEEVQEAVTGQIADAEAPKEEVQEGEKTEEGEKVEEPAKEEVQEEVKEEAKSVPEVGETAEEKAERLEQELADSKAEIALRDAKDNFRKLLEKGKVVPAQEALYLSLSAAGVSAISLSDGSTKSLSASLTELLEAGPKRINFEEEGKGEGEGEKTPYDELSEGEKSSLEKMGTTPDDYNEAHK